MSVSKKKKAIINKFNKDNYVNVTFRLRKGLDKTLIKCLSRRQSKNTVIRDALCDNLLKYECSSQEVYDEIIDIREKLRIVSIICKGFYKTEILEVMLRFFNNGVLSIDGLNIVLNEFNYQYVADFDDNSCAIENFCSYDPLQILEKRERKAIELSKHGYNKEDILSALLFMVEGGFILEDDISELAASFTGYKNVSKDDLENFRHYYNYGSLSCNKPVFTATVHGIVHIEKDDDDFED